MDLSFAKRVVVLFIVLLIAWIAAHTLSVMLLSAFGLSGGAAFIAGLLLYALVFFAVLSLLEKLLDIRIFTVNGK
jgi:hypothetical protein